MVDVRLSGNLVDWWIFHGFYIDSQADGCFPTISSLCLPVYQQTCHRHHTHTTHTNVWINLLLDSCTPKQVGYDTTDTSSHLVFLMNHKFQISMFNVLFLIFLKNCCTFNGKPHSNSSHVIQHWASHQGRIRSVSASIGIRKTRGSMRWSNHPKRSKKNYWL